MYEFDSLISNEIYEAAELYMTTKITTNTLRLKVIRLEKERTLW